MNPLFLLETYYEDNKFIQACTTLGYDYEILPSHTYCWHKSNQGRPHVVFGGVDFVQRLNRWNYPGGYLNADALKCSSYYTRKNLPFLFNQTPKWYPLHYIIDNAKFLLQDSTRGCIFIRPDTARKVFGGFVLNWDNLETELIWLARFNPQILCLIDNGRPIEREYRFFCHNNQVITQSQYKFREEVEFDAYVPKEIIDYTSHAISNMDLPDKLFVVDICTNSRLEPKVLEFNSYCTSGIYECDVNKIVTTIAEVAMVHWKEQNGQEED